MRPALALSALACLGAGFAACVFDPIADPRGAQGASTTASSGGGAGGGPASSSSTGTGGEAGSGGAGGSTVLPDPTGTFVAVGIGGRRVRSRDDGVTWTDDVSLGEGGLDASLDLGAIVFGRGLFVATGLRAMTSPDGVTWQDTPPEQLAQDRLGQLAFGAGLYVGAGDNGSRVSSPDAVVWSQHGIDTTTSRGNGGIAFGENAGFVSINDDGAVSHSPDGVAWHFTAASLANNGYAVAHGNGRFVAIGGGGSILSMNGVSWSSHFVFPGAGLRALLFVQGRFVALTPGAAYVSTSGDSWVEHEAPGLVLDAAAYGHGTFVAFEATRVRRSADGIDWSDPVELGGTNTFAAVTFGPDAP